MRLLSLALVSVLALTSYTAHAETTATNTATPAPTASATPAAPPPGVDPTKPVLPPDIGKLVEPSEVPALQNILQPGSQLRYIGDEHGLKGYFATNGNRGQVVYVTPDGQASFIGALFTADGVSMSMLQLTRLRIAGFDPLPYLNSESSTPNIGTITPPPATAQSLPPVNDTSSASPPQQGSLGEQLLADMSRTSWIAFGAPTGVPVTVFMDPNCDHCHAFFKQLLPLTAQNKIYLRVIPVSVVDPEHSADEIINIMSSATPQQTWINKVNGQAVPVLPTTKPEAATALRINNTTFGRWQLPGTPYTAYKDSASGEVKVLYSEPENFTRFLGELGIN